MESESAGARKNEVNEVTPPMYFKAARNSYMNTTVSVFGVYLIIENNVTLKIIRISIYSRSACQYTPQNKKRTPTESHTLTYI